MIKNFMSRKNIKVKQNYIGGIQMKYFAIMSAIIITTGFSRNFHEATGWEYNQSTQQAFYMLEEITIDGGPVELIENYPGSGEGDHVGAFLNGVCVWFYPAEDGFTTIPLMGESGDGANEGYCSAGDVPDLLFYDASHDVILPLTPGSTLPGWEFNQMFIRKE